ncbi:hypothetical protein [Streptomyces sp. NPDC087437]|uniref:hypothetical protein n=1 Tax=Streptomyces sp. NPDC087437 TaxID=3365789 RepID=UPI0038094935
MRLRLPAERPTEPPTGYKIAHPVLSHDGTRVRVTGGSLGGALPYGVVADAACGLRPAASVHGRRHRPPARLCDCGFHCVHERAAAEVLLGTTEHRSAVLLEVSVLGACTRHQRFPLCPASGCARRRSARARAGRPPPPWPTRAGAGPAGPGRRAPTAVCAGCLRGRTSVTLAGFARPAGDGCGSSRTAAGRHG